METPKWRHRRNPRQLCASFDAITETILINGRGRYVNFTDSDGKVAQTPLSVFHVQPGKKYRFRVINAGSENCPMEGSIDEHSMNVIALDSKYIKPTKVDIITMWAGERVDFIMHASKKPSGNYWFRGHQVAIIHYTDVQLKNPKAPVGHINIQFVATKHAITESSSNYCTVQPHIHETTAIRVKFSMGVDRSGYALRNSTHIPDNTNCTAKQCSCTHVINVKLNDVVELVFIDEGLAPINHPLHLHGHFFRVVASENVEGRMSIERFKQMDKEGKIVRKLHKAPIKDTMKTPDGGYSIVRFLANNPGYWYFHCHFEPHNNMGMSLVFKIGEHKDFPPVPKNFPKCGPFVLESFKSEKDSAKNIPGYQSATNTDTTYH